MKDKELITLLQTPGTKLILEAALTSYMELVGMDWESYRTKGSTF